MTILRDIRFRPAAAADLIELYNYILENAGPDVALRYIERIEVACNRLAQFPERGTLRDDLSPGIRLLGFERRASIAFLVDESTVRIVRVFYGGRNIAGDWSAADDLQS